MSLRPQIMFSKKEEDEAFRQFYEDYLSVPQEDDGIHPGLNPKRKKKPLRASMGPVFLPSNPIFDYPAYRHLRGLWRAFPWH